MESSKHTCKRCNTNESALSVRSEPLCQDCFTTYVTGKAVKRIASCTRHPLSEQSQTAFLLPVSLGLSSVSLLHILTGHLEYQKKKSGRLGYQIHVLYVDCSAVLGEECHFELFKQLKHRYPTHIYSAIPLSNIFDLEIALNTQQQEEDATREPRDEKLIQLLNALSSPTSRADVTRILLIRLITQFAKAKSLDAILWGDSTTRMAERVLSESAKGRGYSLPWQVTDGETPYGIPFFYPLRDVFKKELIDFAKMATPPLEPIIDQRSLSKTPAPTILRNSSIDVLMKQYFESAEDQYPSIVSNVVRTSTRLQPASIGIQRCNLCTLPVTIDQLGISSWEGIQEVEVNVLDCELGLCYGCSRDIPAEAVALLP
jgi:cytoplasmic tRNA 2-thiolation protein 2